MSDTDVLAPMTESSPDLATLLATLEDEGYTVTAELVDAGDEEGGDWLHLRLDLEGDAGMGSVAPLGDNPGQAATERLAELRERMSRDREAEHQAALAAAEADLAEQAEKAAAEE